MARSLVKSKKPPKEFWVEVVACTIYQSNIYSTRIVRVKTLEEAWMGRKSNFSRIRFFGGVAHVQISDAKKDKLDDKSKKFIFVSYD